MRVSQVTFSMTRQVRQYEPERLELVVELEPGEGPGVAVQRARAFCLRYFGEQPMLPEEQARIGAMMLHEESGK